METLEARDWLLIGAVTVGVLFGVMARLSEFCLRSALLEMGEGRAGTRSAAWIGAVVAALLGTQILAFAGLVELDESLYLGKVLSWGTLLIGGLVFGYGMMLARGCPARHLVLMPGGNLRSVVVLVSVAVSSYATLRGVLALPRTWIAERASLEVEAADQGLPSLVAQASGLQPPTVQALLLAVVVVMAAAALSRLAWNAGTARGLVSGVLIGLLVPLGWYVTGVLGFDEFEPVRLESLTFTAPVGNALQYLMTYTGATADFGISLVAGVLVGAFVVAAVSGRLQIEGFDGAQVMLRYVLGGVMMGSGGVLALGCTVGAGLSGVSTLSAGSVLATGAIVAGGVLGVRGVIRRAAAIPGRGARVTAAVPS
jgi:uncharacterized membrane protein YedE/YeeE